MLANSVMNACDVWLQGHPIKDAPRIDEFVTPALSLQREPGSELTSPQRPGMSPWSYYIEEAVNATRFGNAKKAEYFWLAAMQIAECFGSNDSRLAYTLDNAMSISIVSGRLDEAENFGKRALAILQHLYGKKDLRSISCVNNLAGIYFRQKRYAEAEPMAVQVLTEYNKNYGKNHELVGVASNNLAMIYHAQGNYNLAEIMYERALPIQKASLGLTHPQVAALMENYANVLEQLGSDSKCELIRAELRGSGIWHKFDPQFQQRLTA